MATKGYLTQCFGDGFLLTGDFAEDGLSLEPIFCTGCEQCLPCPVCKTTGYDFDNQPCWKCKATGVIQVGN